MNDAKKPIQMDYGEFRKLVLKYLDLMKANTSLTFDDYVTMVRIWNTIELQRLGPRDRDLQNYAKVFFSDYLERASKELNCVVSKGMSFYSPKYDLYIGGKPHPNSEFELKNMPWTLPK